jgi:hypothetical protein
MLLDCFKNIEWLVENGRPYFGLTLAAPQAVSLDPYNLDFGDQVVGRRSKAKRITVTNTGLKPLYIRSVTGEGDNWSDYTLATDTCTGATVDPNKACIIDVTFAPSSTGERSASLKLSDDAYDSPQTVSLKGNGINSVDAPPFEAR